MEELPKELRSLVMKRMLYVEDRVRKIPKKSVKYSSYLQEAVVEFAEGLFTLPLTTSINYLDECPPFPGVYLIYYDGETSLYGEVVKHFKGRPLYVGMSKVDILERLKHHHTNIKRAKDLALDDISVKFIIAGIDQYAPSMEDTLLKFYDPLWNNRRVKLSFGNADGENNNWKKYHIDQDGYTIKNTIGRVSEYIISKDVPAPNFDHHTPNNSP